jgi:hypothetical protein
MKNKIAGILFPVPKKYMPRFFKEGKTVFIKPATAFKELRRGMKLVFYQSQEDTGYVGEATIKRIIILDDPMKFFDTFGDAIFLTREEVKAYLEKQKKRQADRIRNDERRMKNWIALELENIRKYPSIIKPERFVPVGGQYLRE